MDNEVTPRRGPSRALGVAVPPGAFVILVPFHAVLIDREPRRRPRPPVLAQFRHGIGIAESRFKRTLLLDVFNAFLGVGEHTGEHRGVVVSSPHGVVRFLDEIVGHL